MYLEKINGPDDLKKLSIPQLSVLAGEIRDALIQKMSVKGGHLASNLGIVETAIALHCVFDSPRDKIIFDVSHQCYVHKLLTGRKDAYLYEEHYDDVTGYSCPQESEHDFFVMGHTSTSISLACGMARARDINNRNENIIAVIGDASLDGGQAFEALNDTKELQSGLIIVVNDNDMSIPENHGGLNRLLNQLNAANGEAENNYFLSLGLEYIFVKDGHDLRALIEAFCKVKDTARPVVVHCRTQKGKGYVWAEKEREKWHYARPFDIGSGKMQSNLPPENYGAIAGDFFEKKIREDPRIVVVTASIPACVGFDAARRKAAGKQFIDVGIAEQHAVTMTAGLAKGGCRAVFVTHSTFYQRAYDQIEQEMCINQCPATMIITHGGVNGHAYNTHAGMFDIALFSHLDGLVFLLPANKEEYLAMLQWSIEQNERPVMIRVPWNGVHHTAKKVPKEYRTVKYEIERAGSKVAVIALGSFFQLGESAVSRLKEETGIDATLVNPRFASGLDTKTLEGLKKEHKLVVTLEDGVLAGGFGSKIAQYYALSNMKVLNCGFSPVLPLRYDVNEWLHENGLDVEQITARIQKLL